MQRQQQWLRQWWQQRQWQQLQWRQWRRRRAMPLQRRAMPLQMAAWLRPHLLLQTLRLLHPLALWM
jgi:hypothetical protein